MSMERWHRAPRAADLAEEARTGSCVAEAAAGVDGDAAEDLRLLRRYEPVLRFTRGELFLPMSVSAYLDEVRALAVGRVRALPETARCRRPAVRAGRAHPRAAGGGRCGTAGAGPVTAFRRAPSVSH